MTANKIKIALAEDHPVMREGLRETLTQEGFEIVAACENGLALIQFLENTISHPDIVILDVQMPVMNGYQTAKAIRSSYPSIRIVTLTADKDAHILIEMVKSGIVCFLSKDTDPLEITEALINTHEKGYHFTRWMAEELLYYIRRAKS